MPNRKTDEVLAAIDGALSDWTISADAMRWAPDPGQVAADPPIYGDEPDGFPQVSTRRGGLRFTSDGPGYLLGPEQRPRPRRHA
jgi:hypothetical protein